ncbi:MAG: ferrochelatase [Bauldia sp.]
MNQHSIIQAADGGSARPHNHPSVKDGRIGVLLVNLGTPDGTDFQSVKRYLKQFLSDPRVIEIPMVVWKPILHLFVLRKRPTTSGEAYAKIWNRERNESPLRTITRAQAEKLHAILNGEDPRIIVDWAMRYGTPAIGDRLRALQAEGCDRILVAPLYPQYSATTTATVVDQVGLALKEMRWQPAVRVLPAYYDRPDYIEALSQSLQDGLAALDFEPEVVLASYHGMPKRYLEKGDPYYCHAMKTSRLLREKLGFDEKFLRTTFQSRFGKAEWLKPYTIDTVTALGKEGVKRVAVITPAFSADCIETLEEIAIGNAEAFHEHGGERFALIPCLNDSPVGMQMLRSVVGNELKGWM